MLHPINRGPRDNKYCGPAVLSFLTGHNTSDIADVIRARSRGRIKRVKGTHHTELDGALRNLSNLRFQFTGHLNGVELGPIQNRFKGREERPTLSQWLAETKYLREDNIFLLNAGNHWILIKGEKYACGIVGSVIPLSDKRISKRARVRRVCAVK